MNIFTAMKTARAAGLFLLFGTLPNAWALDIDAARHLLTRTGLGAAPHEIAALKSLSREQAVDHLLAGLTSAEVAPPPAFLQQPTDDYLQRLGAYVPPEMARAKVMQPAPSMLPGHIGLTHMGMQEMAQLRVWWLDQMISTPAPMSERLALFWHGHFTSKYFTVLAPKLMYQQLQTIRHVGADNFGELLGAMMRDPAMLIFLDNAINRARAPNENFARELLELFTLGIGHYSQQDIKELAHILAGHSVDFGGSWGYLPRPEEMDTGVKTFLGQTGAWTLADAQRIILENPRTAQFIAGKFYHEFVSPQPDHREIDRLASVLRDHHYEMRPFLRALLLSDQFWSRANRGQLIKSPVELLVGFVRSFGVVSPDLEQVDTYAEMLGQQLFEPPTVQGWISGMSWLDAQTITMRTTMLSALWDSRQAGMQYLVAGADDLLVRVSAESTPGVPAAFQVKVNGRDVYRGEVYRPSDTAGQGQLSPKPVWDLARVPRAQLPAHIDTIEVVFEKAQGNYPNMFLNWVQVDGKRLPAYLATVKFDPAQGCSEEQVPRGMMYCSANARFDLAAITATQGTGDVTLYDKAYGRVNSIIESGTTRVPLAMRPAALAKPALLQPMELQWRVLSRPRADQRVLLAAVSAVPLLMPESSVPQGMEAFFKRAILDPAYNIK